MSNPAKANQSQSSYVDSYVPPSGTSSTAPAQSATPAPVTKVQTPVMAQPTQHNSGQNSNVSAATSSFKSDDPLKRLEELVSEFETKKDDKKTEQLKEIENLQQKKGLDKPASSQKAKDPLAELEKALDAYEKKYKENRKAREGTLGYKEKVEANKAKPSSNAKTVDKVVPQKPVAKPPVKQHDSVQPSPSQKAKDPLVELEQALDEYERSPVHKGKKVQDKSPVNSQAKVAPVSAPVKKSQTESPKENKPVPSRKESGESIEEQNIFELLGVNDASDKEKEEFLDELQQALWEDFLDKDVSLLVTDSEAGEITKIRQDSSLLKNDQQNALIQKIEQFIPDIEEIMLEKALELKEDMVWERVNGVREHLKKNNQSDEQLNKAAAHLKDGRWKTGTQLLNQL
ncbi:MAG: hypothetical protein HN981_01900 [Candidatus Pacebacteria bacterium]|jgi:hypothetical protein|nr:hypothetical protein [Candidatus Paceibacterota bacterium]MBT4652759.1 hypothetical protein [Candidatus Paceibacterota bacterium]MBT6755916.1 hypothetical protein [Candidatus Paceibacterota bacterium]MBT6921129.1 hypothetical protein [Candidatus Paceibacterota bacterium]